MKSERWRPSSWPTAPAAAVPISMLVTGSSFRADGARFRRSAGRANRGHPPFVSVVLAPSRGLLPMTRAPFAASVCDMTTVLVTFTSKHGSTAEIADAIAETLYESGFQVDCVKGCELESLDGYDAVILGSAV